MCLIFLLFISIWKTITWKIFRKSGKWLCHKVIRKSRRKYSFLRMACDSVPVLWRLHIRWFVCQNVCKCHGFWQKWYAQNAYENSCKWLICCFTVDKIKISWHLLCLAFGLRIIRWIPKRKRRGTITNR